MPERKFGLFISSTRNDLEEERTIVRDAIDRLGQIPVGMEFFSAGLKPTWKVIQPKLEEADAVVLIIGAKYGSVIPRKKISFTEAEFNYAREKGKPIIVVMLSDEGIQERKSRHVEKGAAKKKQLEEFRSKLTSQRFVNYYDTIDELGSKLSSWLSGWIKEDLESREDLGWCRVDDSDRDELQSALDVYQYVVHTMTPGVNIHAQDWLHRLSSRLYSMENLVASVSTLIREYCLPRIPGSEESSIRVYFAHTLKNSFKRGGKEYRYIISLSSWKRGDWKIGTLAHGDSGINRVYEQGAPSHVYDTSDLTGPNQRIQGEASVLHQPVKFSPKQVVGVLGFSSPQVKGVAELHRLAEEMGILLSAMFFAYGSEIARKQPDWKARDQEAMIAGMIRDNLSAHFAELEKQAAKPQRRRVSAGRSRPAATGK